MYVVLESDSAPLNDIERIVDFDSLLFYRFFPIRLTSRSEFDDDGKHLMTTSESFVPLGEGLGMKWPTEAILRSIL